MVQCELLMKGWSILVGKEGVFSILPRMMLKEWCSIPVKTRSTDHTHKDGVSSMAQWYLLPIRVCPYSYVEEEYSPYSYGCQLGWCDY
jgi:hypothetical protein